MDGMIRGPARPTLRGRPRATPRPRPTLRSRLVLAAVATIFGVSVAGCGATPSSSPSADAIPVPSSGPIARAEASQGPYRLVFELEAAAFAVDEPIDGRAWLEVAGGAPVELRASGSGLVLFELREIGGTRGMGGWTADCRRYEVAGRTEPVAIKKSGGYSTDDPDAAWYIGFFNDPLLRLPAGRWELTALADFTEGECGGPRVELRAPITITVGGG